MSRSGKRGLDVGECQVSHDESEKGGIEGFCKKIIVSYYYLSEKSRIKKCSLQICAIDLELILVISMSRSSYLHLHLYFYYYLNRIFV